jgi:hypothetical protein
MNFTFILYYLTLNIERRTMVVVELVSTWLPAPMILLVALCVVFLFFLLSTGLTHFLLSCKYTC